MSLLQVTDKDIVQEARYYVEKDKSLRETAEYFNRGKTSIYRDVCLRLEAIDAKLYARVRQHAEKNSRESRMRFSRSKNGCRCSKAEKR